MVDTFHLRLLGQVELTRGNKPTHGFESRKAVALLGYLALHGQALSRSHLADLFWGDKPESQGRNNLSRVLHNLTGLLPGLFQNDHYTVTLVRSEKLQVDTATFEENVARGTPEALLAAADLYRDELMAGLFLDDCPDFEIWLLAERERWRQRLVDVLETLVSRYATRGQLEPAVNLAARLVSLDQTREDHHRQLILLFARSGQTTSALGQFETCRRVLADELGVAPSAETVQLYERIRAGEIRPETPGAQPAAAPAPASARGPSPSHTLPPRLTTFVGREREVAEISDRLRNPACRLLTLVGPAGVGKTRLGLEVASTLVPALAEGVCFASLASLTSPQFLLTALMDAAAFSPEGPGEAKTQFLDYLEEKRFVFLLDSFEHLLDGTGLVLEMLQAAPRLKVLVTSSERLNVQAEWLVYVQGLAYPSLDEPNALAYGAVKLFVDRAASVDPEFRLSEQVRPAVVRICQLVEGLPLGLELAAAWVGKFSCPYIAAEIERNLDFLTTSLRDMPARHRSLRAALDWSYKLLSPAERLLLRRLSVFSGGFTVEAADGICTLPGNEPDSWGEDRSRLQSLLGELLDHGLVLSRAVKTGEPRFSLMKPVRDYVRPHLAESGEQALLEERHARFFLSLAETAEPHLTSPARVTWLSCLEADYDNIRAAFAWALRDRSRAEIAQRLAGALIWYWYLRNHLFEGRQWVEETLQASAHLARMTPAWARALFGSGAGAWLHGDYATARSRLEESIRLARELDLRRDLAFALSIQGRLLSNLGDFEKGLALEEESVAIFRGLGEKWGLALSLANVDSFKRFQGNGGRAQTAGEEALALFRELNDPWGIALVLSNRGLHAYQRGDYATARALHAEALVAHRSLGDKWLIAQSLYNLGNISRALGDFKGAHEHLRESLMMNRELGTRHMLVECLEAFAALAAVQNEAERAARLLGAADALREAMGAPLPVYARAEYDKHAALARAHLDRAAWNAAWNQGRAMPLDKAADYALEQCP